MPRIDIYIDHSTAKRFAREIPKIRKKRIALLPWDPVHTAYGVGGNTFRAFGGFKNKPSVVYQDWARAQCNAFTAAFLQSVVVSQNTFDAWHSSLAKSLQTHWRKREEKILSIAQKYKLVDLFVKWLTRYSFPLAHINEGLVKFGHCALDRHTLSALNEQISMALPIHAPSMGHITTEQSYHFCQTLIREICHEAGGTPILFDYYAWPDES